MSTGARANGLEKDLGNEEKAGKKINNRLKQPEMKKVSGKAYLKTPAAAGGVTRRIALVVGDGEITRGRRGGSEEQGITASAFIKLLKQVEDDSSIKSVNLPLESPGRRWTASDQILHPGKQLKQKN